ncbi:Oidioi.mRNA.OKI2018_I69.chr1.g2013.t1.cds [Oikopleura dioica]|uniref:Oidioi.mRNA.OKI2018_I69.chr1.g2013.t1.cds n=1 Tax=Oikopleura dioica TaxID=34765 RepID=A0ABN7SUU9_OIKDI|nr:Oidioi.mRNA.OKI2018_I69.chr1.g2013.t1.cds [Oikopleura dioica]
MKPGDPSLMQRKKRQPEKENVEQRPPSNQKSPKKAEEKTVQESLVEKGEEEGEIYPVEKIIGRRNFRGTIQYAVLWENWSIDDATWEPLENLTECGEKIKEFEEKLAEIRLLIKIEKVASFLDSIADIF